MNVYISYAMMHTRIDWPPWIYYYHRYSTRVEYLDDIIVFFSSLLLGAYQLDIISAHSKNQLR